MKASNTKMNMMHCNVEETNSNPCSGSDSDCEETMKLAIPGVSSSEFSSTESETEYGNTAKRGSS